MFYLSPPPLSIWELIIDNKLNWLKHWMEYLRARYRERAVMLIFQDTNIYNSTFIMQSATQPNVRGWEDEDTKGVSDCNQWVCNQGNHTSSLVWFRLNTCLARGEEMTG